jgi:hypothetical protein
MTDEELYDKYLEDARWLPPETMQEIRTGHEILKRGEEIPYDCTLNVRTLKRLNRAQDPKDYYWMFVAAINHVQLEREKESLQKRLSAVESIWESTFGVLQEQAVLVRKLWEKKS